MKSFENLPFIRGVSRSSQHPFVESTPTNRKPRDIEITLHEAADLWFLRRFGVRFRSQSIFVTSLQVVASAYGPSVFRILPLSEYRYCWSKKTSDLLSILKGANVVDVPSLLDAAQYVDTDLEGAHRAGHEVMLHCEKYVAIPHGNTPPDEAIQSKLIVI